MSVEQLKNGSKYDSYAVDDVVRKLDALMDVDSSQEGSHFRSQN